MRSSYFLLHFLQD